MSEKVHHYNVWVEIEGVNEDGDYIEGDGFHEPYKIGECDTLADAEHTRDVAVDSGRIEMTARELSIVLAALRYFQLDVAERANVYDILVEGPACARKIDELFKKINTEA